MQHTTAVLLAMLSLGTTVAWAEKPKPPEWLMPLDSVEVKAWEEGEGPPVKKLGPGFRRIRRSMGTFSSKVVERSRYQSISQPSFFTGYRDYWTDLSATSPPASNAPHGSNGNADSLYLSIGGDGNRLLATDYGMSYRLNIRFSTLSDADQANNGSFEIMGQHLSDADGAFLNSRPALRVGVDGPGYVTEVGQTPVAELAEPETQDGGHPRRWLDGIKHCNYLAYGVKFVNGDDFYRFDGVTDVAGRIFTHTDSTNRVLGPQFRLGRVASKGPFSIDLSGSLLLGYGRVRSSQSNGFGDDALPGAPNKLLFLEPTYSRYRNVEDRFGTHAEARLATTYRIRSNWRVDAVARAFVTGPWGKSSQVVQYNAPDFGLGGNPGGDYLTGSNLFVEMTYLR